jgi:hypothetical protein
MAMQINIPMSPAASQNQENDVPIPEYPIMIP